MDHHFLLQETFPTPEIEPASPALAGGFVTTEPLGKHLEFIGTHTKLCNILLTGYQRILINTAPSGYCRWSLQISMLLYIKNIQDNSGKCSVFFNPGFCDETSLLSQSCHMLRNGWVCFTHEISELVSLIRRGGGERRPSLSTKWHTLIPVYYMHPVPKQEQGAGMCGCVQGWSWGRCSQSLVTRRPLATVTPRPGGGDT